MENETSRYKFMKHIQNMIVDYYNTTTIASSCFWNFNLRNLDK
jgi:hypothetical protein